MAGKKKESAEAPQKWEDVPEIPKEEQPYPLPEGWKWVYLGSIIELISGRDVPKTECNDIGKGIPYILGASNLKDNSFSVERWIQNPVVISERNDVLLSVKGTLGELYIQKEDFINISRQIMACRPFPLLFNKFLYFYLLGEKNKLQHNGWGLIPGLSREFILKYLIPLPIYETQQRIVNHIESLFSKLDEAAEKVQVVIYSHEARKQAILHKAFSGDLTQKWREENGTGLDSWEEKTIKDIGEITTGSTPSTKNKEYYGGEIPFIKPTDLSNGRYVQQSGEYLSEAGKNVSRTVRAGSTCVCCIGATISKCGFLICDVVTNQQINTISPHNFMNDLYVYYYCLSDKFKNSLIENSSATTLPIINKSKMGNLKIIVPLLREQNEIVRIIELIFYDLDNLYNLSKTLIDKIIAIKLVLLKKIFQGKLL